MYWWYSSFIYPTSQLYNEESRGAMNKVICSSHPETQVLTGWNWFLSYSTPSSQNWSEPSIQIHTQKGMWRSEVKAEQSCLSCQRVGEEWGGNKGSKPSKWLLEMCTEMKTPENQPNGIKRRLLNLFWEERRCCPSQRDFFKVLTDTLLLKCHYIYIVLNSAVSRLYSLTTISSRGLMKNCYIAFTELSPQGTMKGCGSERSHLYACMSHHSLSFNESTTLSSYLCHIPKEAPSHRGKVYLLIKRIAIFNASSSEKLLCVQFYVQFVSYL